MKKLLTKQEVAEKIQYCKDRAKFHVQLIEVLKGYDGKVLNRRIESYLKQHGIRASLGEVRSFTCNRGLYVYDSKNERHYFYVPNDADRFDHDDFVLKNTFYYYNGEYDAVLENYDEIVKNYREAEEAYRVASNSLSVIGWA